MATSSLGTLDSTARVKVRFDKVRRDITMRGALMISAWTGFLLAVKFFG